NCAIDGGPLHERPNDAQILLGFGSLLVHWLYFLLQKKIMCNNFFRIFLVSVITDHQNGEGTFTRKIEIIASAIISLASIAPMFPNKLPHPARPASIMRLPAMTSPTIAPTPGPTNKPIRPKNNPTRAPRIAPSVPHLVAPKYFAPK